MDPRKNSLINRLPSHVLKEKSLLWSLPIDSREFALRLDKEDHLSSFRSLFCFPKKRISGDEDENNCLYFCGHSLGLKPKSINSYIENVLDTWSTKGVYSHFS